jgi:hypothetical protein
VFENVTFLDSPAFGCDQAMLVYWNRRSTMPP